MRYCRFSCLVAGVRFHDLAFLSIPLLVSAMLFVLAIFAVSDAWADSAPDIPHQFGRLQQNGDPLVIDIGTAPDADICHHYQGIGRRGEYLFITRNGSHNADNNWCPLGFDYGGDWLYVKMGSRNRTGARYRSNRLDPEHSRRDTPSPLWEGAPRDRIVDWIEANNSGQEDEGYIFENEFGWEDFGGFQSLGDEYYVATKNCWPYYGAYCPYEGAIIATHHGDAGVYVDKQHYQYRDNSNESHTIGKIDVLAATNRPGGDPLFIVTGDDWDDGETLLIMELRDDNWMYLLDTWSYTELPEDQQDEWRNWQFMNLVRDSLDGKLYLVCGKNTTADWRNGQDWLYLYEVAHDGEGEEVDYWLEFVDKKRLRLGSETSGSDVDMGDLDAGAGLYVSPAGELMIYTIDHDNEGPNGSIEIGEFRSRLITPDGTTSLSKCDGWVQLYDKRNGWNLPDPSDEPARSITFDVIDRNLDSWWKLGDNDGWNDDTKSLTWSLPPGQVVRVYRDSNYAGSYFDLTGTGVYTAIADLRDFMLDGTHYLDWEGEISSLVWLPQADGGGPYSATEGGSVSLSAANPCYRENQGLVYWSPAAGSRCSVDDPLAPTPIAYCTDSGTQNIRLVAMENDTLVASTTVTIEVENIAPTATFQTPALVVPDASYVLMLSNPFDPSIDDMAAGFSYAFDCGSGDGYQSVDGNLITCAGISEAGNYVVKGKIFDKDGGVSEYTKNLAVHEKRPPGVTIQEPRFWEIESDSFTSVMYLSSAGNYSSSQIYFRLAWGLSPGIYMGYSNYLQAPDPGTGFGLVASGLKAGTTYYYRGECQFPDGMIYTGEHFVTTTPLFPTIETVGATDVTGTTALLQGDLLTKGAQGPAKVYFGYHKSGVTTQQYTVGQYVDVAGEYSETITDLTPATTYNFYARVKSSISRVANGSTLNFTTAQAAPVVTTNAPTDITTDGATLNGSMVNLGGPATAQVRFAWGTVSGGPYPNASPWVDMTNVGDRTYAVSGLTSGMRYFYRIEGKNTLGTRNGEERDFRCGSVPATILTDAATDIRPATAVLNGRMTDKGSSPVGPYIAFEWGVNSGVYTHKERVGTGTMSFPGAFHLTIATSPGTTYYYHALGESTHGMAMGEELSFTTPSCPTIDTLAASAVGTVSADVNAAVSSFGSSHSVQVTFTWGPAEDPVRYTTAAVTLSGTGEATVTVQTGKIGNRLDRAHR